MSKYKYLKKNKDKIKEFIREGYVSPSVLRNIEIYEYIQNHKGLKMQAYTDASFKFRISESAVRKIYKDLNN